MREELEPCPFCGRQAAIDALDRIFDRCEEIEAHLPEGDPDRDGYEMYPDYLTVWRYLRQLPSAQRWIPCSERLPKRNGEYLVWMQRPFDEEPTVSIINYDADCEMFGDWREYYHPITLGYLDSDFDEIKGVIAWMPLPEPYKGE